MNDLFPRLTEWATLHGIGERALVDLVAILSDPVGYSPAEKGAEGSEEAAQIEARLAAIDIDAVLWRNNSGAMKDETGRQVRFGLGNDSKRINSVIKSADLIGVTRVVVEPHHVGRVFGIFTSFETKRVGWKFAGTPREVAQNNFLNVVKVRGGIAGFIQGRADVLRLAEGFRK